VEWILTVAAIDYIKQLKVDVTRLADMGRDANTTRQDFEKARQENSMLREEITSLWQNARRMEPNSQHIFGPHTSQLAHDNTPQSQAPTPNLPRSLPPPANPWTQGSNMMQGVEYQPSQPFDRR
jgi:hypothetical protein